MRRRGELTCTQRPFFQLVLRESQSLTSEPMQPELAASLDSVLGYHCGECVVELCEHTPRLFDACLEVSYFWVDHIVGAYLRFDVKVSEVVKIAVFLRAKDVSQE